MILNPQEYSSNMFSWHPADKEFSAFESDFGALRDGGIRLGRVYDDACDVGFTMVSERTGNKVVFAEWGAHKNLDGDISHWEFRAVTPGHKDLVAFIWND